MLKKSERYVDLDEPLARLFDLWIDARWEGMPEAHPLNKLVRNGVPLTHHRATLRRDGRVIQKQATPGVYFKIQISTTRAWLNKKLNATVFTHRILIRLCQNANVLIFDIKPDVKVSVVV
jgi:hypothetical protein